MKVALAVIALAVAAAACAPTPPHDAPYDICNGAGCGDNVTFIIDND